MPSLFFVVGIVLFHDSFPDFAIIGRGHILALCGGLLARYGYSAWNLCFIVPAAIALVGAVVMFTLLKDDPSGYGLPPVSQLDENQEIPQEIHEKQLTGRHYKQFLSKMVFRNPIIWGISIQAFSLIRLERDSQLVIPVYNYSLPENECVGTTDDDPCSLFGRIRFPVEEFYPPDNLEERTNYRSLLQ